VSHLLIVDAADEPGWFLCKPHGNEERTSNYAPIWAEFNLPIAKICCEIDNGWFFEPDLPAGAVVNVGRETASARLLRVCQNRRMSPASDRPFDFRSPYAGDLAEVTIRSDIGAGAALDVVAARLDDLAVLVGLGERWGFELARAAAGWDLHNNLLSSPDDLGVLEEAERLGFGRFDVRGAFPWGRGWPYGVVGRDPVPTIADVRAVDLFGSPVRVVRIEYANPLELILVGSGMLLTGVILTARLVRDWSNKRAADGTVVREARAEASITEARADLYRWLVDETKAGRAPMPVGELVSTVTPSEIKALNRVADSPVVITVPGGSEPPTTNI
jgi:hypothetical protein